MDNIFLSEADQKKLTYAHLSTFRCLQLLHIDEECSTFDYIYLQKSLQNLLTEVRFTLRKIYLDENQAYTESLIDLCKLTNEIKQLSTQLNLEASNKNQEKGYLPNLSSPSYYGATHGTH